MFKFLFSVVLIISCAFAAEPMISDTVVCVSNKVRVPVCSSNPLADMCLSPYPLHQRPPLYMVTLPHGQRIIFLGTTHCFPLTCMMPYVMACELIEQSSFVLNEGSGSLLGGCSSENRGSLYARLPDSAFVNESDIREIERRERSLLQNSYQDLELERQVKQSVGTIFDENGRWYEKSGILVAKEGEKVVLLVRGTKLAHPAGKELHPLCLLTGLYYEYINTLLPPWVRQPRSEDGQLSYIAASHAKTLYALEAGHDLDSASDEMLKEDKNNSLSVCNFKNRIESCVEDPVMPYDTDIFSEFYSAELTQDDDPEVIIKRNQLWLPRIMSLNGDNFRFATAFVGVRHLWDLFKNLEKAGCRVSDRLSLADLEGVLLDETALLQEHTRLKEAHRNLRF